MSTTFTYPSVPAFIGAPETTADGSMSGLVVLALAIAVVVLLRALVRNAVDVASILAVAVGCLARAFGAVIVVAAIFVMLILAIIGRPSAQTASGGPVAPTTILVPAPGVP